MEGHLARLVDLDASDQQLESLSAEELDEFQRLNVQTIASLKSDINLLRWKLKQFGPGALPGQDYNALLRQGNPSAIEDVKEKLKNEIEHHVNRLKETILLTGVTMNGFNRNVHVLDDQHCMKEFTMEVTVFNRRVRLSCSVEEEYSTSPTAPQGGKVTWFEMQFQEDIHSAIGEEIKKAAEKIAHHNAFALLKSYLNWRKERDDTVLNLSESNPETVSLFTSEDGKYRLRIANPKPNRPMFTVEWGRKTVNGRVLPDLHLEVDAPENWTALDTNHVIDSAPQIFETMVTTLGLEKALGAFVQLVATDGQPPQAPPQVQSTEEAPDSAS